MAKGVTLADIAEKVGVSSVAVSKALSGKPGVSGELRSRIKEVAEQMGYKSNTPARSAAAETGNIGVIVPENYYGYSFSFYGQLYEEVVRALYDNQYYGILELLSKEDEQEGRIPRVLQGGKVDGVIFLGQMDPGYIAKMVSQAELPCFFLDAYLPSVTFDTVISDGYYGTYLLTNYLIERGHKRIGFVGNVEATDSIADRFWGYRKALRENQIPFEEQWEITDRSRYGRIFSRILNKEMNLDLDAYVCNCDPAAYVVIQDLEEMGYRVPEDISVVGFDDYMPGGMGKASDWITTYRVDMKQMAEVCVRSLINKIRHEEYVKGIQIVTGQIKEKNTVKRRS